MSPMKNKVWVRILLASFVLSTAISGVYVYRLENRLKDVDHKIEIICKVVNQQAGIIDQQSEVLEKLVKDYNYRHEKI